MPALICTSRGLKQPWQQGKLVIGELDSASENSFDCAASSIFRVSFVCHLCVLLSEVTQQRRPPDCKSEREQTNKPVRPPARTTPTAAKVAAESRTAKVGNLHTGLKPTDARVFFSFPPSLIVFRVGTNARLLRSPSPHLPKPVRCVRYERSLLCPFVKNTSSPHSHAGNVRLPPACWCLPGSYCRCQNVREYLLLA